ncbi:MAG: hypothetical protein PVF29_08355 [Desulfobacterales bacterium]|jgi:hypothetical protein
MDDVCGYGRQKKAGLFLAEVGMPICSTHSCKNVIFLDIGTYRKGFGAQNFKLHFGIKGIAPVVFLPALPRRRHRTVLQTEWLVFQYSFYSIDTYDLG